MLSKNLMAMFAEAKDNTVIEEILEKDFNLDLHNGWGGLHLDFPTWVHFSCPKCLKFHSDSFLFVFERDKTEYYSSCLLCGVTMRIKIPLEMNNRIYDELAKDRKEFDEYCDLHWKARQAGFKYTVFIRPAGWDGYKYSISLSKEYGNSSGLATEAKTKEDAIRTIQDFFKQWEKYDGIAERQSDKVTNKTLYFWSFTKDITKEEILHSGQSQLGNFI